MNDGPIPLRRGSKLLKLALIVLAVVLTFVIAELGYYIFKRHGLVSTLLIF